MPDKKVIIFIITSVSIAFAIGYLTGSYFPLSKAVELIADKGFRLQTQDMSETGSPAVEKNLSETAVEPEEVCELHAEVSGAVNYPGVYCMTKGSLINDALVKAGGMNKLSADRYVAQKINLAQRINDNEKIYFPFEDDLQCEKVKFMVDNTLDRYIVDDERAECVNLNFATEKELDSLPGVGSVTAVKIIESRPYKLVTELKSRKIVSDKVFNQIEEQLCL